ncbi:MAG: hypothetical protein IT431_01965 [Phycisphaerales bacterium]|nr:hypothetical protein [Phycisphaerales bacterium]
MPWEFGSIIAGLAAGLRTAEAELAHEQAVHGLDALDEVQLHPLLAAGLRSADLACFRETPYPGPPRHLPRESERPRCDLVVAPSDTLAIADIVRQGKELRRAQGTLFAALATELHAPPHASIAPEDALWIEVKTIGQHTTTDGVAGPNRSYASQFNACLADIRKLANARAVQHAALALVLFNESPAVAEHDLTALMHKCLDRSLPVADLWRESLPITDRIGNSTCTIGLVRVRPAPQP